MEDYAALFAERRRDPNRECPTLGSTHAAGPTVYGEVVRRDLDMRGIANDEKLPIKQTFTKKGDAAYDSALVVTGAEGKPMEWEDESCRKLRK